MTQEPLVAEPERVVDGVALTLERGPKWRGRQWLVGIVDGQRVRFLERDGSVLWEIPGRGFAATPGKMGQAVAQVRSALSAI